MKKFLTMKSYCSNLLSAHEVSLNENYIKTAIKEPRNQSGLLYVKTCDKLHVKASSTKTSLRQTSDKWFRESLAFKNKDLNPKNTTSDKFARGGGTESIDPPPLRNVSEVYIMCVYIIITIIYNKNTK